MLLKSGNYIVNLLKQTLMFRTWIVGFGHPVWVHKLADIVTNLCSAQKGHPCSKLATCGRMQSIYLNGGGDSVLSAKRCPTWWTHQIWQIYPMQKTQPIDFNGGGNSCRRLIPCSKCSQLTQMVVGTVSLVQKGAPHGEHTRCGRFTTCSKHSQLISMVVGTHVGDWSHAANAANWPKWWWGQCP